MPYSSLVTRRRDVDRARISQGRTARGRKIHDLVMQGIEMALKKRGYPWVEELKAGKKR